MLHTNSALRDSQGTSAFARHRQVPTVKQKFILLCFISNLCMLIKLLTMGLGRLCLIQPPCFTNQSWTCLWKTYKVLLYFGASVRAPIQLWAPGQGPLAMYYFCSAGSNSFLSSAHPTPNSLLLNRLQTWGEVRKVDAWSYYFNLILHPIRTQDYVEFPELYNFYATLNTGIRACKAILKLFLRGSRELEEQAQSSMFWRWFQVEIL